MERGKAFETVAEPMTTSELDRWLQGKIPRRHLAIPFGGPFYSKASPLGVDKEGEWFDEESDLYGGIPELVKSRKRLVDFHHMASGVPGYSDPTGVMNGAVIGYMDLDREPSAEEVEGEKYYGLWADMWARTGEHRRLAIGALERRNTRLYGSSVPVAKATVINPTGHIDVWPVRFQAITIDPINRFAVLPPLAKAELPTNIADLPVEALRAFLAGEDDLAALRLPSSQGAAGAKAGRVLSGVNESDIDEVLAAIDAMHAQASELLRAVLARHRKDTP